MSIGRHTTKLTFLLLLTLGGCRGGLEASVKGIVSYQGKPVPYAILNFHYQEGRGPMAYAVSDEDGSYEVFTGSERGLLAGHYFVAIESPAGTELPKHYSDIATSGLEYDIKTGLNEIDISLE